MKLKRLVLENFGIHRDLDLNMDGSVVGLTGDVASGKSTVLNAINFLFSAQLANPQESYVNNRSQKTTGSVTGYFSHNGTDGVIRRTVGKKTSRELRWGDEEPKTSAADVEAALASILDTDRKVWESAVFIAQGDLQSLLSPREAERENMMIRLLGLGYCAGVAETAAKQAAALARNLQDLSGAENEVEAMLQDQRTKLSTLALERVRPRLHAEQLSPLQTASQALADLEREKRAETTSLSFIASLKTNLAPVEEALQRLATDLRIPAEKQLVEEIRSRRQTLEQNELMPLQDAKSRYEEFLRQQQRFESLQQDLRKKKAELKLQSSTVELMSSEIGVEPSLLAAQTKLKDAQDWLIYLTETEQQKKLLDEIDRLHQATGTAEQEVSAAKAALEPAAQKAKELYQAALEAEAEHKRLHTMSQLGDSVCEKCFQALPASVKSALPELLRAAQAEVAQAALLSTQASLAERELTAKLREAESLAATVGAQLNAAQDKANTSKTVALPATKRIENPDALVGRLKPLITQLTELQTLLSSVAMLNQVLEQEEHKDSKAPAPPDENHIRSLTDQIDQLQKQEQEAQRLLSDIGTTKGRLRDEEGRLLDIRTLILSKQQQLDDLRTKVEKRLGTDTTGAFPLGWLELARAEEQELQKARNDHQAVENVVSDLLKRMDAIQQAKARDAVTRGIITDLGRIKEAFSREGLPRTYIRRVHARLVDMVQQNLLEMDADFSVRLDENQEVAFEFCRHDGDPIWMPMSALSGGQGVLLCISFLLAVQQLIIPNLGFLVLDEPSVHLHANAVEKLRDLLVQYGEKLQGTDSQVVVCDHNDLLQSGFSIHHRMPSLT